MRKIIASVAIAALLAIGISVAAHAATKPTISASIIIDPQSSLVLGGKAFYDVNVPSHPGWQTPMVEENCYQNGQLVYGSLLPVQGGGSYGGGALFGAQASDYPLGGSSSPWLENGGIADCTAQLALNGWKGSQEYRTYLAEVDFTTG